MMDMKYYPGKYNLLAKQFLMFCLSDGGNVMISPLSVLLLLALAADSSAGETRQEILKVLGDESGKNDAGRILCRFRDTISGREFSSADAVCVRNDFADRVNMSYKDLVLKAYGAELFASSCMKRDIDAWVEKKTRGMIRDAAPDGVDTALMCMINAVMFEADWLCPYDDWDVKERKFYNGDGTASRVKMMYGSENCYLEDEDFTGFMKEYRSEGGFSFMALLPRKKGTAALKDALDRVDFVKLCRSVRYVEVDTVMPEFRFGYEQDMTALCQSLGIQEIFRESADFSPVSPDPLKLEAICHKTFIDVNQFGTRAAAVTLGPIMVGCLPPEEKKKVVLNRPFVFAIVHEDTGIPVFAGVVSKL